ncbi:MAG: acetylglutamate kinase [Acidimicrobiales bacterium]
MTVDAAATNTAEVLVEALPYLRRFAGRTIVVKYGGNALHDALGDPLEVFASDIVLMHSVGLRPVVVHGGGPQISALLQRLGIVSQFVEGLRVTDRDTLDIARMVLVGKVNKDIVSAVNTKAPVAVGISGEDGAFLRVTPRDPALGYVGDVRSVDTTLLDKLLAEQLVPVIATIGTDDEGNAYNVNADTAAAAIAAALGAEKLIHLTNVEGIRSVAADAATRLSHLRADELDLLLQSGALGGGMAPKAESCLHAVRNGVAAAHVLDGRVPHVLLLELFTEAGIGTMVTS